MNELDRIRAVIARARDSASSSEHRRGNRRVVLIDADDIVTLTAVTEHWVLTFEQLRARRRVEPGEIAGCSDG